MSCAPTSRTDTEAAGVHVRPGAFLTTTSTSRTTNALPAAAAQNATDQPAACSNGDGLLLMQGGAVRWITAKGEQQLAGHSGAPLAAVALRDALARWQSGKPPATGVSDCFRAMQIVDRAYAMALIDDCDHCAGRGALQTTCLTSRSVT